MTDRRPAPRGEAAHGHADREPGTTAVGVDPGPAGSSTLDLVRRLCEALEAADVAYCHWKSNQALDRSASGENDLDLLLSRADAVRVAEILARLGFKQAMPPAEKRLPGVLDHFGYDAAGDALVHVHAHYRLVLGHDRSKNYRLPIEDAYLRSAGRDGLFRVPEVEFEYLVFVVRMILKHATWDAIVSGDGGLVASERRELAWLRERIDGDRVREIVGEHLPYVGVDLFERCAEALDPTCSAWRRARTAWLLERSLRANARRRSSVDKWLKAWRRLVLAVRRRVVPGATRYRLGTGGAMVAIVGGDGAGKSTAVDGIQAWLSKHFKTTTVHMGKPAWSWTTLAIRAVLKLGNLLGLYPVDSSFKKTLRQESPVSPGYPWMLRELCKARDRYLTYRDARRFAARGGIVVLDRFPLPPVKLMDGPRLERFVRELEARPQGEQRLSPRWSSPAVRFLERLEAGCYDQIVMPDLLIALLVDPEIAVRRKTDEAAASVRERSTEMWELDWDATDAYVIDASRSPGEVLAEIRALMWSEL